MKVHTPEISWHGRDPVYSCDVQPHQGRKTPLRIATAGTDSNVRIWYVKFNNENKGTPEFASNLSRHNKAVNCVRWSPNGQILASGADDGCVILWQLSSTHGGGVSFGKEDEEVNQESWSGFKTLRGHLEDVYDMCWSPDGSRLISGSVDNSAIIWDISKGEKLQLLKDHRSFVQGVAWDPRDKMCATISCDRSLRIYNLNNNRCLYNIIKMPMTSTNNEGESQTKHCRMFHDDTMKSFFRRLAFTPDGEILIAPAGSLEMGGDNPMHTTFLFTRNSLPRPVLHLPGPSKATVAVRCSPVLYEHKKAAASEQDQEPMDTSESSEKSDPSKEDTHTDESKNTTEEKKECLKETEKPQSLFNLPYRMIFAVATEDSVLLYDTQQNIPFAMISNLHYSQLSDMAWSSDGKLLVVSSTDGYCTLIAFEEGELGVPYKDPTKSTVTENVTKKVEGDSSKVKNAEVVKDSKANQETTKVIVAPPENNNKTSSEEETTAATEVKVKQMEKSPTPVVKTTEPGASATKTTSPPVVKGQPRRVQVTTLTSSAPKPRRVTLTTISSPQDNK